MTDDDNDDDLILLVLQYFNLNLSLKTLILAEMVKLKTIKISRN